MQPHISAKVDAVYVPPCPFQKLGDAISHNSGVDMTSMQYLKGVGVGIFSYHRFAGIRLSGLFTSQSHEGFIGESKVQKTWAGDVNFSNGFMIDFLCQRFGNFTWILAKLFGKLQSDIRRIITKLFFRPR